MCVCFQTSLLKGIRFLKHRVSRIGRKDDKIAQVNEPEEIRRNRYRKDMSRNFRGRPCTVVCTHVVDLLPCPRIVNPCVWF